jgi:hypothetical protein
MNKFLLTTACLSLLSPTIIASEKQQGMILDNGFPSFQSTLVKQQATMRQQMKAFRGTPDLIYKNGFEASIVIASTSFEEIDATPFAGIKYTDTGDQNVAHDLINNSGQPPVDTLGGTELGINAIYEPYDVQGVFPGLTDGDFVGVTGFSGVVTAYTDGTQGYQFSDADGNMIAEFETVDLTTHTNNTVSIDYFVQAEGYEGNGSANTGDHDSMRIFVRDLTNSTEIDIFNTIGTPINSLGVEGVWITGSVTVPDNIMMQLVIRIQTNGSGEAMYIDNVVIKGE